MKLITVMFIQICEALTDPSEKLSLQLVEGSRDLKLYSQANVQASRKAILPIISKVISSVELQLDQGTVSI